jgi:hypothetical protein
MNTYDIVTIQLNSGDIDKSFSILPTKAKINFFCITSDQYGNKGDPTKVLEYSIKSNDPTPEDIKIVLDRPHVLIGESVLDQMGNFSNITFSNKTDTVANVRVFVGRNV